MEDTILINSNVAYHTCRNDVQHQHINWSKDCSKESVPTAVDSRVMHKAANQHLSKDDRTRNHRSLNELEVDNLKVALVKMKKLLVCVILICASLVMTILTAITLSALSYRLGQMNDEHQIRLDEVNGTLCNTIPQDILQLDEYIQKKFASLQTQLYCGAGQWHRIAFLNMSDPTQQCPSAWREYNTSGVRACGRTYSTEGSCSSVTYTAENLVYSRVCGQLVGSQVGSPDAFSKQLRNPYIDIDGVNITRLGTPHYHIWSFAGGLSEDSSLHRESNCPSLLPVVDTDLHLTLVVITTVNLATQLTATTIIRSFQMIQCGMGRSVKVPAVLVQITPHGSVYSFLFQQLK